MKRPDFVPASDEHGQDVSTLSIRLLRFNRPLLWFIVLVTGLVIFSLWLPAPVRLFFWQRLQTHSLLTGMTLGFGLIALSLLWTVGQRLDVWAFLFLNLRGYRPIWLDRFMWAFTQIGNSMTTLLIGLAAYLAGERLLAYTLVLGTLTLWMVVELIKALVRRRRPFLRLTQARVIGPREGGRSFPSGHTSQVFFTVTFLVNYFEVSLAITLLGYGIALLVGFTRMYVGVHYPRDVLAGLILGSIWGLLGGIVLGQISLG